MTACDWNARELKQEFSNVHDRVRRYKASPNPTFGPAELPDSLRREPAVRIFHEDIYMGSTAGLSWLPYYDRFEDSKPSLHRVYIRSWALDEATADELLDEFETILEESRKPNLNNIYISNQLWTELAEKDELEKLADGIAGL